MQITSLVLTGISFMSILLRYFKSKEKVTDILLHWILERSFIWKYFQTFNKSKMWQDLYTPNFSYRMVFISHSCLWPYRNYYVIRYKVWIQFYFSKMAVVLYHCHLLGRPFDFFLIWDVTICLTQFIQHIFTKCWLCVRYCSGRR